MAAGPGWIVIGIMKMLAGAMLAYLAVRHGFSWSEANNPTQMYQLGYSFVFDSRDGIMAATVLFVCLSQIKINMTNAYAGSLAWSNFFARLTHSHPGRVVWMVFNALIAVMLMELSVFQALEQVLGLYANIAISWIAVVVADLVINKPLGLSPPGIEFKRAYLYDINPVGVGAMLLASLLSVSAFFGIFGIYCAVNRTNRLPSHRLVHPWQILHRQASGSILGSLGVVNLQHLRESLRIGRHGALHRLSRGDMFVVLHTRCALQRSLQTGVRAGGHPGFATDETPVTQTALATA